MRWLKWTAAVAIILFGILYSGWMFVRQIPVSVGFSVRAEFKEFPKNDRGLEEWLAAQPGVVKVATARDVGAIRIYWIMSRKIYEGPPIPDPRTEFDRIGYRGLIKYDGRWSDSKPAD
jgi:hypothetical protein